MTVGPIVRADVTQLDDLAKRFAATSDSLVESYITPALRDSADMVVAEAKSRASFSTQIPPTIKSKVTPTGKKSAAVVMAGPVRARRSRRRVIDSRTRTGRVLSGGAHAGLYEYGSLGSSGKYIRRPLFGNLNHWFNTPTKPFLRPAYDARQEAIIAEIEAGLDRALRNRNL